MDTEHRCTLSDKDLIALARDMVSGLCASGGRTWTLRVPVDFNRDHDMILSELIDRFEKLVMEEN
jgi:hypothetical protein